MIEPLEWLEYVLYHLFPFFVSFICLISPDFHFHFKLNFALTSMLCGAYCGSGFDVDNFEKRLSSTRK